MGLKTKLRRYIAGKKYPLETYKPLNIKLPANILQIPSAWTGLESIVEDILDQFQIERNNCIEFGTEYCYSTVAFSNFFKQVRGIDIFIGDAHSGRKKDHYLETKASVAGYQNIELFQSDYRDWIKQDHERYDFAHVDIIHSYEDTYACGLWAVQQSKCCIFHDTESFSEVRRAVFDIAKNTGKKAYNYPFHHGLGIIV